MVYIVALFEAPTVAQLAAHLERHYARAVARVFGGARPGLAPAGGARPLEAHDLAWLRERLPAILAHRGDDDDEGARGAPAVFILAPHRSGTTLLRVMLAGHPRLFAAPELQLLGFSRMDTRRQVLQGSQRVWREGLIRAIMEIKACGADEAGRLIETHERRGASTRELYHRLQDWVAPRTLVDKSPSYALDPRALRRAERYFEGALYIHLVRHPAAMARSFEDFHMDRVLFTEALPYPTRQVGELVWTASHQNILDFLEGLPAHRWVRMRFEDLTAEPERVMRRMCETLRLEFHPALLRPYEGIGRKMADGIHPASVPMGDTKFRGYGRIVPEVGECPGEMPGAPALGEITWRLAERLGYDARPQGPLDGGAPAPRTATEDGRSAIERQRGLRRELRAPRPKP
jgi:hypothetical protein